MSATSWLDEANTLTSNAAEFIRNVVDRAVAGEQSAVEELRPLAQQFDALFADGDNPIPDPPEGGVSAS